MPHSLLIQAEARLKVLEELKRKDLSILLFNDQDRPKKHIITKNSHENNRQKNTKGQIRNQNKKKTMKNKSNQKKQISEPLTNKETGGSPLGRRMNRTTLLLLQRSYL